VHSVPECAALLSACVNHKGKRKYLSCFLVLRKQISFIIMEVANEKWKRTKE
jgi:hypothetical protein